jgi:hypothetical protein
MRNLQRKEAARALGLKHKTWRDILIITSVAILVAFVAMEAKAEEPQKIVSPIPLYDMTDMVAGSSATISPDVKEYIKVIFGNNWQTAYAIAQAESGLKNDAKLSTNFEYSIGLFQINLRSAYAKVHYDRVPGKTLEEKETWLSDPYNNILMAYWIESKAGNWEAWSTFTNGSYKNYL